MARYHRVMRCRLVLVALALAFAAAAGCGAPLRSDGRWTELRSDHFRVLTDVDPAGAARELPRVETILAGMGARVRPGRPLPPRIDLLWLRAREGTEALGVGGARGYYLPHQGDEPSAPPLVVVAGEPSRDVERALVHELAHVFFVDAAPGAPAWLAEGMAAWWDTLDLDGRNVGFDDDDGQAEMSLSRSAGTRTVHLITVAPLLHASYAWYHQSLMSGWLYASARAFIAMLLSDAALAARLDSYIALLRNGVESERAFGESFAGLGVRELQTRFDRFWVTHRAALPLEPWRGNVAMRGESPPAVERWLARARPWDSPHAIAEAGRALARAAADDSAERHYWSGVYAASAQRFDDASAELRAALARDPTMTAAASALARVQARLRASRATDGAAAAR
jgi:hypothetical protein